MSPLPISHDLKTNPRALKTLATLMQLEGPVQAYRRDFMPDTPVQNLIDIRHEEPDMFHWGGSSATIQLDGYRGFVRWDEGTALTAFFEDMPLVSHIVDDYTMLMLDRLAENAHAPQFAWTVIRDFREEEFDTRQDDEWSLFAIDSFIHHARASKQGTSPNAVELPAWVMWYAQFIPYQRRAVLSIGERFLMTHLVSHYQFNRRGRT